MLQRRPEIPHEARGSSLPAMMLLMPFPPTKAWTRTETIIRIFLYVLAS